MSEREEQHQEIKDLWNLLETKVSWSIFIAIMIIIIGLFGYFATADSNAESKIIKLNDKTDGILRDTNDKFLKITNDLGQIKGALNIKDK